MSDKKLDIEAPSPPHSLHTGTVSHTKLPDDDYEVFKSTTDGVQFRLVGWVRASVIFLKCKYLSPSPSHPPRPNLPIPPIHLPTSLPTHANPHK
jgi:hypothetical protein